MDVEVVRSPRRRKTVQARVVDGKIRVLIPAWMSTADEQRHVADMVRRLTRRATSDQIDVEARARTLASRYGLPRPVNVRFVDNQAARWGSCTPADGTIRLSSRLAAFPPWVLDYVLVHELSHLVEANHGPRFHALVDRYPLAERARGFLIAVESNAAAGPRVGPHDDDADDVTAGGPPEQGALFDDAYAAGAG